MAAAASGVTPALLVVGELCVDLIVALTDDEIRFGQHEQLIPSTGLTMGSSSAITACGAAALGVPTAMIGVVGADEFGDYILRELSARGLDVSSVRIDAARPTGSSTHLARPTGDRAILTAMGTIGHTVATDVSDTALSAATHLHVGSYFLQHALWEDAPALFARAHAAGLTTSLDGNFDPAEAWDSGILNVLPHTDALFGNDQELTGIAGIAEPDAAVDGLLDRMAAGSVVVHKLGADGAVVAWREGTLTVRVRADIPDVAGEFVDTVGAGDTLAAAFLAARLAGASWERSLALGVACGTASTRGVGGIGAQPSRDTADTLADLVHVRAV